MWLSSVTWKILDDILTVHDFANRFVSASVWNAVTLPPTGGHEFTAASYHSLMFFFFKLPLHKLVCNGELQTHKFFQVKKRALKKGLNGLRIVLSHYKLTCYKHVKAGVQFAFGVISKNSYNYLSDDFCFNSGGRKNARLLKLSLTDTFQPLMGHFREHVFLLAALHCTS